MKLLISKSKNACSYYVSKSIYVDGKRTSKIVKKLGTHKELKEKQEKQDIMVKYSPRRIIPKGRKRSFNGGYLFLQKIYYEMGLDKICRDITKKYKFEFDLNDILSRLTYSRIIFPSSKRATLKLSKNFLEQPGFDLHQIYRALSFLAKETDFIQSQLYKNSLKISSRKTGVLYYDCTNYYFEIEH